MVRSEVLVQILVMAGVTALVRALPLTLLRKPVRNIRVRSFLQYVPYVTLSVMTFPAIINVTGNQVLGAVGFAVALVSSLLGGSLPVVAALSCASVYVAGFLA